MDMNREAVNAALMPAGNMPLTDDDRRYNNIVYDLCKKLYLPTLFTSLGEIDWRCARKEGLLALSPQRTIKNAARHYYALPADCIKPVYVDDNAAGFINDGDYLITERPAKKLYYVFHNRRVKGNALKSPETQEGRERSYFLRRPDNIESALMPGIAVPRPVAEDGHEDDEFPEWEYTPYDADFWQYFSYKFAAALIPKLRADDGAAGRVQAVEAVARQKGEEAVQRSRGAQTNPQGQYRSRAQKHGLSAGQFPSRDYVYTRRY